jgi:hypothetical protein
MHLGKPRFKDVELVEGDRQDLAPVGSPVVWHRSRRR